LLLSFFSFFIFTDFQKLLSCFKNISVFVFTFIDYRKIIKQTKTHFLGF